MGTSRKKRPKKKGKSGRRTTPFPFEFRLKVVKLYLEDGYPATLIAQQFGISKSTIGRWGRELPGMHELFYAGVDPNDMHFKRFGCRDVGVQCGGWGKIVMEIRMEDRQ